MGSIELCEGDFIEFLVDGEWSPIQIFDFLNQTRIISRLSMFCYFGIYRYALRQNDIIKMDRPGPY